MPEETICWFSEPCFQAVHNLTKQGMKLFETGSRSLFLAASHFDSGPILHGN